MAENANLVRDLYEAWNERDFDRMLESTATDATIVDVGSGQTYRGHDGVREYSTAWADAFPDGKITVDRVIEAGDMVVAEVTGKGKHTGELVTPGGTIPATGRTLTLHLCDIWEVKDGKLQSQRTYFDTGSMMAQLGLSVGQPSTSL
jgi:steroid delta-isomerase-like uncharacterized protein